MGCVGSKPAGASDKPKLKNVSLYVQYGDQTTETTNVFDPYVRQFNLLGTLDRRYTGSFTFSWIAEDTHGVAEPNYEIVSVSAPASGLELYSKAQLPRAWPEGNYRVDISAAGEVIHSAKFRVQAPAISLRSAASNVVVSCFFTTDPKWCFALSLESGQTANCRFSRDTGSGTFVACDNIGPVHIPDLTRGVPVVVDGRTNSAPGMYRIEVVVGDAVVASKKFRVSVAPASGANAESCPMPE